MGKGKKNETLKNQNDLLDNEDYQEITDDVKAAFNKAKGIKEETNDVVLNQEEIDKNVSFSDNSKKRKMPIIVSIAMIVIIALTLVYWYLSNNPRTIFLKSIDGVFRELETNLKDTRYDVGQGSIDFEYTNKTNASDDLKFSVDYIMDSKNDIINADISTSSENAIKTKVYSESGKSYLYLDGSFDKYIELEDTIIPYYTKNDAKTMLKSLNKALANAVSGEKFTSDDTTVTVGEDKISASVASLELTSKNLRTILNGVRSNLENDNNFLESYSNITGQKKENVKNSLSETFGNFINVTDQIESITVNIYTTRFSHDFIKVEFLELNGDVTDTISLTKTNDNYEYLMDIISEKAKTSGTIENDFDNSSATININNKTEENNKVVRDDKIVIKNTEKQTSESPKIDITDSVKAGSLSDSQMASIYLKLSGDLELVKLIMVLL